MAWWVVAAHALHLSGLASLGHGKAHDLVVKIVTATETPVSVFIILSGFVITHLMLHRREDYTTYITKRFLRLFPIFAFCVVLAILVKPLYLDAYTGHEWVLGREVRLERALEESRNFGTHLFAHALMLHGVLPDQILKFGSNTFLSPAWSLSLEWQFYLLAPLIIRGLFIGWRSALATAAVFALVAVALRNGPYSWEYPSFLPLALPLFFVGIASRLSLVEGQATSLRLALLVGSALSAIAFFTTDAAGWLAVLIWGLYYLLIRFEIGLNRQPTIVLFRVLKAICSGGIVTRMGEWSYSTYLVHIPVLAIFVGAPGVLFGVTVSQWQAAALIAMGMGATVPVSYLLYNFVEHPFIEIGRRIGRKAQTAT